MIALNWKAVFVGTINTKIFGHQLIVNEELSCRREEGNILDPYVVTFVKSDVIVGHVRSQLPVTYSCSEEVLLCAKLHFHSVIPEICLKAA